MYLKWLKSQIYLAGISQQLLEAIICLRVSYLCMAPSEFLVSLGIKFSPLECHNLENVHFNQQMEPFQLCISLSIYLSFMKTCFIKCCQSFCLQRTAYNFLLILIFLPTEKTKCFILPVTVPGLYSRKAIPFSQMWRKR